MKKFTLTDCFRPLWRSPRGLASWPIVSESEDPPFKLSDYPSLAPVLNDLTELTRRFEEDDMAALRLQDRFRREQLWLILGSFVVTVMGGAQAAFGNPKIVWLGIAQAAVAAALTGLAALAQNSKSQPHWSTRRLRAEALRREFFLYVGRIGLYSADATRLEALRASIAKIVEENPIV